MARLLSCQTCGVDITRESGVFGLLEPGDNVMVARGFDISGIVSVDVTVNIPPFLVGCDQLKTAETEETMSIASVHIHVERAIGRIKTYPLLDGTLPNTLSPYATQIVAVVTLQGFVLGKLDLLTCSFRRETKICKCDRFFPK